MRSNGIGFTATLGFVLLAAYFGTRLGNQAFVVLGADYWGWAYIVLIVGIFLVWIGMDWIIGIERKLITKPDEDTEEKHLNRLVLPVSIMFCMAFCFGIIVGPFEAPNVARAFGNGWGFLYLVGIFPIVLRIINSVRPKVAIDQKSR